MGLMLSSVRIRVLGSYSVRMTVSGGVCWLASRTMILFGLGFVRAQTLVRVTVMVGVGPASKLIVRVRVRVNLRARAMLRFRLGLGLCYGFG